MNFLAYTMQLSDNVACDILFDYIGGVNVVDEYIHSLGINDVSITTTEDEMHQDMDDCYKKLDNTNGSSQSIGTFL